MKRESSKRTGKELVSTRCHRWSAAAREVATTIMETTSKRLLVGVVNLDHTFWSLTRCLSFFPTMYRSDYVYLCRKRRGAWKESYALDQSSLASAASVVAGTGARIKDPESENQEGAKKDHSGAAGTKTSKKEAKMNGKNTKAT